MQDRTDSELDGLCLRWAHWHRTRRMFAPPIPKNILSRMQPRRVREAPDVELSAELSLFNTASNALRALLQLVLGHLWGHISFSAKPKTLLVNRFQATLC
ncbi:hypothetical protein [Paraburkholderia silvatlantica]|uniref:hypothetical protein n=1 Tax=Paraburkholderia silvatlantica TaxID=321895 RepID=UPI0010617522|nr:hypothetical protein [Paraburkholderia silvatlantica]TDR04350.1 hypothetical protein C7412_102256 [Paraburkholderia silvatlantica]